VLLETCRQARAWQEIRPADPPLMACVNLSVRQLRQTDFVTEVLGETGLDPGSLVLEVTGDAVMEDAQSVIAALKRLKDSGVKLAIDDFGTEYSSLSYLRRLPVDYLKIDRSFVERLREMGCNLAQGNHFSRPLAAADAKRWLERDQASTP
jgi:EAL domain-containing protein (putative c-di-GMP-specific phosphodiesterase class I)